MIIRELDVEDADKFVVLNRLLSQESDYMLLKPSEAGISVDKQAEMTRKMKLNNVSNVFVAEVDARLAGYIGVTGGLFAKNKHTCHFAVGVLKAYQRKAIATKLIETMEAWAGDRAITRIELSVVTENVAAVALYNRCGYKMEGLKKASLIIKNRAVDEYLMAKTFH